MPLPDHLADLERKVSARLDEALADFRRKMRHAVEAGAQRASSALLSDLDEIGPLSAAGLLAEQDLSAISGEERGAARRDFARSLRSGFVAFDRARTQSAVLEALLASARPFGDHAALWLMRPQELLGWASLGFAGEPVAGVALPHDSSPALQRLAEGRGCVRLAGADAAHLASVLEIEAPKQAVLVPLVLRDRLAAVLYLDAAASGELDIEALQILALAAAQRLELQALTTRSYTPTLFLDGEAPEGERGLAPWDPNALAAEPAMPATSAPTSTTDEAGAARTAGVEEVAPTALEEEHDTIAESMPTVAAGFGAPPPVSAPVADEAEIAWQLEESEATPFMESVSHKDLMAELEPLPPLAPLPPMAPTAALPAAPPAEPSAAPPPVPDLTASAWREVDESTSPYSVAAASESTASTIAFVPPVGAPEPDIANDATVRILRPVLQPPAPPPPPPVASEPEAPEEQTHPSLRGPGVPADEPTLTRGGRTTEVVAPADLQGPGWAFSSARSPRGSGESALHEEARRLARLLVSEIKLYNEDQVEEGRHNRDIYLRLKEDIDRSRQIYEERVHESVRNTTDYFQQELLRSLAGGDPRALGI